MSKGIGTPQNRELAYRAYAQFGGRNIPAILECLKQEHGIKISTQTLYVWKREGDWEGRLRSHPTSFEEKTLISMMGLIETLERRLSESKTMDPQAVFAYTRMVNTFFKQAKKIGRLMRTDPETIRRTAQEILERDYGIMRDGTRRFDV